MTDTTALRRRILRRETHSPRSALAIGTAVVLTVLSAYTVAEFILHFLAQPPLIAAPVDMLAALTALPDSTGMLVAVGVGLALIGLLLLLAAITPGRLARHTLPTRRGATVVDNEVIASALARSASRVANVSRDSVRATVSHRRVVVRITPSTGSPVDARRVSEAIDADLARASYSPPLRARVLIERDGKVGA